jgi:formylglycine-generating enzyme
VTACLLAEQAVRKGNFPHKKAWVMRIFSIITVTGSRAWVPGVLVVSLYIGCSNGANEGDATAIGGDGGQPAGDGDAAGDGDGDMSGDGDGSPSGDGDGDGDGSAVVLDVCDDLLLCGPSGTTDCCQRVTVAGGTFLMGMGDESDACPPEMTCGAHEAPEHEVRVDSFLLDAFEVTVGRMRAYVEAFDELTFSDGEGAHPLIPGSGWQEAFEAALPSSADDLRASLKCHDDATWTDIPGDQEALPVNCVNWAVAFSYCAQIGGRLPTEAEWEYAAAGGDQNRLYPWGSEQPTAERANFYPGNLTAAGELAGGEGRYGNFDLAGNVWEWVLDWLDTGWYSGDGSTCENCARVTTGTHRAIRGGAYTYQDVTLRATTRSGQEPSTRDRAIGFRCAYVLE